MVRVLKALLARACIPFCLLQVLRFETDQLLYTDVIFLSIWITFTTACIIEAADAIHVHKEGAIGKFVRECLYILCMIVTYACIHMLFMERSDMRKYLLTDHGFPYMNFKQILNWICFEIWSLCLTLYHYLMACGLLRPLRLICFVIHLVVNAIVLAFIVETVVNFLLVYFYLAMYDSFHHTFDVNNTNAYPNGYLSPEMVDRSLYDKSTVHLQLFSCHSFVVAEGTSNIHDLHITCTQPFSLNFFKKDELPLEQHSVYRYPGEDVQMRCYYSKKYHYEIKPSTATVWYLNETIVANSSRHTIVNNRYEEGELQSVLSVLTIKLLKHYDFGEYKCVNTFTISKMKENKRREFHTYHEIYQHTVNVFKLNLIKMQPKIIHKIVGNLITSENFFWFHTDDDLNDISIRYTINDRPVDEVCPGFQTQVCSIGASILRNFIGVGAANFDWNGIESFPYLDLVLPLSTVSLFRKVDDSHLYKDIEKLVEEGSDLDVIEHEIQQYFMFVAANEEKVLTNANIIQSALLISFIIFVYLTVIGLGRIYYKVFIVMPARRYYLRPALPEIHRVLAIEEETFDVYLSYADEEYNFMSEKIVPFLEGECNLRVCLASRDIPQNRSIFGSYVENIRKCRKIIVIISRAYLAEPRCAKLQLEHIILPLYYDQSIAPHNLLLLRYDESRLPDILRWNFDVDVLPWVKITQLPEPVMLQKLKLWLLTGRVSINCRR